MLWKRFSQRSLLRKCWNCGKLKIVGIRCDCFPDKYEAQKRYEITEKGKAARNRTYINQILKGNK